MKPAWSSSEWRQLETVKLSKIVQILIVVDQQCLHHASSWKLKAAKARLLSGESTAWESNGLNQFSPSSAQQEWLSLVALVWLLERKNLLKPRRCNCLILLGMKRRSLRQSMTSSWQFVYIWLPHCVTAPGNLRQKYRKAHFVLSLLR